METEKDVIHQWYALAGELFGKLKENLASGELVMFMRPSRVCYRWTIMVGDRNIQCEESVAFQEFNLREALKNVESIAIRMVETVSLSVCHSLFELAYPPLPLTIPNSLKDYFKPVSLHDNSLWVRFSFVPYPDPERSYYWNSGSEKLFKGIGTMEMDMSGLEFDEFKKSLYADGILLRDVQVPDEDARPEPTPMTPEYRERIFGNDASKLDNPSP